MEIGTGYGEGTTRGMGPSSTEELKAKASGLTQTARGKAMQKMDANKEQVCSLLERVADTVKDDRVGGYAADYARRSADYLRRHSTEDLVSSARAEVRSRPGLMLSACFVAGLAFARMIRR